MGKLDGGIAIITGAASGMGKATVELFVREGAKVLISDIDYDRCAALARDVGGGAIAHQLDVTAAAEWQDVVEAADRNFGGLNILINAAGIFSGTDFLESTEPDFDRMIDVNLKGAYLGMRACAPLMGRSGGGAIVNVASVAGLRGGAATAFYRTSKWGLLGLSRSAAYDLATLKIRVNAICPGNIDTPLLRTHQSPELQVRQAEAAILKRLGTAEEIAIPTLFLASSDSSFITGIELRVDGGLVS